MKIWGIIGFHWKFYGKTKGFCQSPTDQTYLGEKTEARVSLNKLKISVNNCFFFNMRKIGFERWRIMTFFPSNVEFDIFLLQVDLDILSWPRFVYLDSLIYWEIRPSLKVYLTKTLKILWLWLLKEFVAMQRFL